MQVSGAMRVAAIFCSLAISACAPRMIVQNHENGATCKGEKDLFGTSIACTHNTDVENVNELLNKLRNPQSEDQKKAAACAIFLVATNQEQRVQLSPEARKIIEETWKQEKAAGTITALACK